MESSGILERSTPLPFDRQSCQSNKAFISSNPFHLLVVYLPSSVPPNAYVSYSTHNSRREINRHNPLNSQALYPSLQRLMRLAISIIILHIFQRAELGLRGYGVALAALVVVRLTSDQGQDVGFAVLWEPALAILVLKSVEKRKNHLLGRGSQSPV